MGFEGFGIEGLEGVSPSFVESLYRQYSADPGSVDPSWQSYFDGLTATVTSPSWARSGWPPADASGLTDALDPTRMTPEAKAARKTPAAQPTAGASIEDIARAVNDSIRAMMLIRTYRVRGHLLADLDPLKLAETKLTPDLTPEYHGFFDADLDRPIYLAGTLGFQHATVRELLAVLRRNYCGHVGLEYMHISDIEERRFLQERMEGKDKEIHFTDNGKKAILAKVIDRASWTAAKS